MKVTNLFNEKKVVFSFEIFPPKKTSGIETIYKTLGELKGLNPDFISVTYGAGGTLTKNKTCELSSLVRKDFGVEAIAHLTCISSTKEEINILLENLKKEGISNILALRGDVPVDSNVIGEFKYATELISHINARGDFNIVAACYPEGHLEHPGIGVEIENMKRKVDAGASHFISQLFFDNKLFYKFNDEVLKNNINVPIEAGIMPVVNTKQIARMATLCGAYIPKKFLTIMDKYENDPIALRDAGIAYANEQIVDLISNGVRGIHLYTMNNSYVAKQISNSVGSIITSINK